MQNFPTLSSVIEFELQPRAICNLVYSSACAIILLHVFRISLINQFHKEHNSSPNAISVWNTLKRRRRLSTQQIHRICAALFLACSAASFKNPNHSVLINNLLILGMGPVQAAPEVWQAMQEFTALLYCVILSSVSEACNASILLRNASAKPSKNGL